MASAHVAALEREDRRHLQLVQQQARQPPKAAGRDAHVALGVAFRRVEAGGDEQQRRRVRARQRQHHRLKRGDLCPGVME